MFHAYWCCDGLVLVCSASVCAKMITVNIYVSPFLPLVVCVCVGSCAVVVVVVGMCVEQYVVYVVRWQLYMYIVSVSGSAVVVVVDVGIEGMQYW